MDAEIKLLRIEEVAKILNISKPTTYNLLHTPGFPRIKIGRAWRVDEQLLNAWIKEKSLV